MIQVSHSAFTFHSHINYIHSGLAFTLHGLAGSTLYNLNINKCKYLSEKPNFWPPGLFPVGCSSWREKSVRKVHNGGTM